MNTNIKKNGALWQAVLFGGIALLAAIDLFSDLGEGTAIGHIIVEATILIGGTVGLTLMLRRYVQLRGDIKRLELETESLNTALENRAAEAARWREEARSLLRGLGVAIDRQFMQWKLSPAEKEVALLLLKGLSHKEIADVRGISEATARQQARAVYKKAGLKGRHDLAAFFLEDLLLPVESCPKNDH